MDEQHRDAGRRSSSRPRSAAREVSSRELLELYLDRIERLNRAVNAVVTLDADRARAAADAADDATRPGGGVGPLHGLPITIKDAIETEGIRSTGGAVELTDHVPTRRRARGRPAQGRRRDRVRQDEPAALVGRRADLQRASSARTNNPWDVRPHHRADRRAARPRPWPPGSPASRSAPTSADRCASRRTAVACSGSSRASAWSRSAATSTTSAAARPTPTSTCSVRSRAAPTTSTCCVGVLAGPDAGARRRVALELPACEATLARRVLRIGVWFDDPACRSTSEYARACSAPPPTRSPTPGAVDDGHPPVEFARTDGAVRPPDRGGDGRRPAPDEAAEVDGRFAPRVAARRRSNGPRCTGVWAEWFEHHDLLLCPVLAVPPFPHVREGNIMDRTVEVDGDAARHRS